MQHHLAEHRRLKAPCIFCSGPYYTMGLYYDASKRLPCGRLYIMCFNTCQACMEHESFAVTVDAAYCRDLTQAHERETTRRTHTWLN